MKKIIILILLVLFSSNAFAADTKLSGLTADASPTGDDLLYTVDDPGGTPTSKKATITNVLAVGGFGDITAVYDTASGAVTAPTIGSGQKLDGGTNTNDGTNEGILLGRGTTCTGATSEGQTCWDTDDDFETIGDGSAAVPQSRTILVSSGNGAAATRFFAPGASALENATEANVMTFRMPFAGRIANFFGTVTTVPGAGKSWTCTIRTDEAVAGTMADTAVTFSIADTNATNSDQSNSATVSKGKLVTIAMTRVSTASAPGNVSFSFEVIGQ